MTFRSFVVRPNINFMLALSKLYQKYLTHTSQDCIIYIKSKMFFGYWKIIVQPAIACKIKEQARRLQSEYPNS